jgi:hypothetical protein
MIETSRILGAITSDPDNKFWWYEYFKRSYTLEQGLLISRQKGWKEDVVRAGYELYTGEKR